MVNFNRLACTLAVTSFALPNNLETMFLAGPLLADPPRKSNFLE
jgi:hypothetical protein